MTPSRARAAAAIAVAVAVAWPGIALAVKRPLRPTERVDLNRASAAELMRLPGVGQKRAAAILALRARRPFRRPEDVLAVKGLGPGWFARVRPNVVTGEQPASPAPPPQPPHAEPPARPGRPSTPPRLRKGHARDVPVREAGRASTAGAGTAAR